MASRKTAHRNLDRDTLLLSPLLRGCIEMHFKMCSARAAGRDNALALGIEVEKETSFERCTVKPHASVHPGLLVGCENALDCGMRQRIIGQNRQHNGYRDAVVRAEGGSVCMKCIAVRIKNKIYTLCVHILVHTGVFLEDHVYMTLKYNCFCVLISGRCTLEDDDIVQIILNIFKPMLLCK